jgi:16S rRNA (adenine1518-N6/adenine1519-N6)-dimethyltransferase
MRQRLGQHFLRDQNILKDIAATLGIVKDDIVIEIGPGHGELTQYLFAAQPERLIVIEKDKDMADKLENGFGKSGIEIVQDDILKVLPDTVSRLDRKHYKLIGNIPYYITGYLLRTLGELEPKPELIVLTIQKEVAGRVCAAPPKMNLLAASVQFWAEPKIEFIIKSGAFSPPPEVDGAVLILKPGVMEGVDPKKYYKLIKTLFKQPRKTILNNLEAGCGITRIEIIEKLKNLGIDPTYRPQNLRIDEIKSLSTEIYS